MRLRDLRKISRNSKHVYECKSIKSTINTTKTHINEYNNNKNAHDNIADLFNSFNFSIFNQSNLVDRLFLRFFCFYQCGSRMQVINQISYYTIHKRIDHGNVCNTISSIHEYYSNYGLEFIGVVGFFPSIFIIRWQTTTTTTTIYSTHRVQINVNTWMVKTLSIYVSHLFFR